jgi:trk system potassium uptake protein TrkA
LADSKRLDAIAVIGLGRFGSAVARELTAMGREVLAIDDNMEVVQSLSEELAHVVQADCTNPSALCRLGVNEFGSAVVAIGSDIEASVLTVLALAELGVPCIWAKATNDRHRRILQRTGAHHVVAPEVEMGQRVAHLVTGRMMDFIELDDGYAFAKTAAPRVLIGRRLGDTQVRENHGITVVGLKRPGADFTYATEDSIVSPGDVLIVSGATSAVERFTQID